MITRIEIDGFKNFSRFELEVEPFQLVLGSNGAGKSNLLEVLRLFSLLAGGQEVNAAFRKLRGGEETGLSWSGEEEEEFNELFTINKFGRAGQSIRLAVEMLVDKSIADNWGRQAQLKSTRLRYELEIRRTRYTAQGQKAGIAKLHINHEALANIPFNKDNWAREHQLFERGWLTLPKPPKRAVSGSKPQNKPENDPTYFISTLPPSASEQPSNTKDAAIYLHQDERPERRVSQYQVEKIQRTVLSGIIDTGYKHALSARQEMLNWRFVHLQPPLLRQPAATTAEPLISEKGGNLPRMLAWLEAEDPRLLAEVSIDLVGLVSGSILQIKVEKDELRGLYEIRAKTQDGRWIGGSALSGGTLKMLALAALCNDPGQRGVLCVEELETSLYAPKLKELGKLLGELATDFSAPQKRGEPLRQLLVTTHSASLVNHFKAKTAVLV